MEGHHPSDGHRRRTSERVGDVVTGQILGKDRTTVIHYRKKHESNMRYWTTYPEYFETASHIVDSTWVRWQRPRAAMTGRLTNL